MNELDRERMNPGMGVLMRGRGGNRRCACLGQRVHTGELRQRR